MSYIKILNKKGLITPPKHVVNGIQFEVVMGSVAYGVTSNESDIDIYGFSIPNKEIIFPHLNGEILGFGTQTQRFEQYQQHHVKKDNKVYDLNIYNIIKYFQLCMENNPNMIDSLFVPRRCVLFSTKVGEMVRENRKLFLHKGAWFKFKGYAYSQIHKIKTKKPEGKRKEIVDKFGYDVKFGYHCVRLLNEVEMILIEGDLDLERNREQLKSIRRGEWTIEDISNYFNSKEIELEKLYTNSNLRYSPDEESIKQLLLNCLEEHFGSLSKCVFIPNKVENILKDLELFIDSINNKYKEKI